MSQQQRPASTAERLSAIEKRLDGLEHTLLDGIRSLGLAVSQMISLRQSEAISQDVHHVHEAPAQPQLVFEFKQSLTDNTMYRVYQDAHDHPVTPSHIHIHTRRDLGSSNFDNVDVDENLRALMIHEFQHKTGGAINAAFFVEVYRETTAPVDQSSFLKAAPVPAVAPTPEMPTVQQGVYEHLTPGQQMAQLVAGLTADINARQLGDSRAGLPVAGPSK